MDFTGRPMRGYVHIDPPGLVDDARLEAWVGWCAEHATGLPAKKPRAKPRP